MIQKQIWKHGTIYMKKEVEYKVSVIVPIYNVERYLRRAIDSLLVQTLEEIEIILVDDGSPDGCAQIIDEYADQYRKCFVLHKQNGGVSDARNAGMEIAHGEYIAFVDPDDYIEPNMIEKLYIEAKSKHSDLVICGYFEEFSENDIMEQKIEFGENHVTGKDASIFFINGKYGAYAWNKLFKKSLIDQNHIRFPKGIMISEDTVFFSRYLQYTKEVAVIEEGLYHYIRNTGSICAKYHKRQYEYYKAGNDAKVELIDAIEMQYSCDCMKLRSSNAKNYLQICLNIFDQLYSLGNAANLKEKYANLKQICNEAEVQEIINLYKTQIEDRELLRKIKWIQGRKYLRLCVHEIWKMRVIGRIKYFLG